jgi:hypothetical protein
MREFDKICKNNKTAVLLKTTLYVLSAGFL